MNIKTCKTQEELDFGGIMCALHDVCQADNSFSELSRQMLKEIICEPDLDVIPTYLTWERIPAGTLLWHEGDIDNSLGLIVSGQVSLMKETASLAVLIYKFSYESPYEAQNELAWAAALVLVVMILLINLAAQAFSRRQIAS